MTKVGGNEELVIDGQTGLVPQETPLAWLELSLLAQHDQVCRDTGQAGRRRVECEFSFAGAYSASKASTTHVGIQPQVLTPRTWLPFPNAPTTRSDAGYVWICGKLYSTKPVRLNRRTFNVEGRWPTVARMAKACGLAETFGSATAAWRSSIYVQSPANP